MGENQVIDLLTNLSRRVYSLEQQLRDTQGNVEKLAEELANTKHRVSKHAAMFGAVEERVGMLTDDIVELDERTQGLNRAQGFYNDKTSVMEFTVDMILHDLNGICEKLKKVGGGTL
jgi:chromosome segregation ATPase